MDDREPVPTAVAAESGAEVEDFSEFYRQFVPSLVAFLMWQGASLPDAADVAQETMIRAYRYWSTIDHPRAWARRVASRTMYEPGQAVVILVDYRRGLLGCVEPPHLIGYGTSAQQTADLIEQAAAMIRERLPGPEVTAEQLRNRSWWRGPELFVLVDDYDLVAASTGPNPLGPLLDYLPQSRDVGLHVVITRRAGGASRALSDPILRRLRELGSPGIVLSGPREEGPLLGSVEPDQLPPGRGWLVTRRTETESVRLAWTPPAT